MTQDEKRHLGFALTLVDTPDQEAKAEAGTALYRYNVEATGVADRAPIGAKLSDPATGEVLGGLWGRTELGLLFLSMFVLPKDFRGLSLGSQLLSAVEEEAKRRGCKRAVTETSTFQAPGFYERHGYEEFGRVEYGLPGHARVWLRKDLIRRLCDRNPSRHDQRISAPCGRRMRPLGWVLNSGTWYELTRASAPGRERRYKSGHHARLTRLDIARRIG